MNFGNMDLVEISQNLLAATKAGESTDQYIYQLEDLSLTQIFTFLDNDNKKKAFWINTYNAFATILLKPNPTLILNPFSRRAFFNKKQIYIGQYYFSLNDIEHNILRKSSIWWSKGYLKKWLISESEKRLRVDVLDPRIHFALNCGGMGCPPIRHYKACNLQNQLDTATRAFLFSEVKKDKIKNSIKISELFNWYIGDFGGKQGIINLLIKNQIISNESKGITIIYTKYNWQPWINE